MSTPNAVLEKLLTAKHQQFCVQPRSGATSSPSATEGLSAFLSACKGVRFDSDSVKRWISKANRHSSAFDAPLSFDDFLNVLTAVALDLFPGRDAAAAFMLMVAQYVLPSLSSTATPSSVPPPVLPASSKQPQGRLDAFLDEPPEPGAHTSLRGRKMSSYTSGVMRVASASPERSAPSTAIPMSRQSSLPPSRPTPASPPQASPDLSRIWYQYTSPDGYFYFMNAASQATQWAQPPTDHVVIPYQPQVGSPSLTALASTPQAAIDDKFAGFMKRKLAKGSPESEKSDEPAQTPPAVSKAKGAWKRAVAKVNAGIKVQELHKEVVTQRELREQWKKAWEEKGILPTISDASMLSAVMDDGEKAAGASDDVDEVEQRVLNTHLLDLPPATPQLRNILKNSTTTLRRAGYSTSKRDVVVTPMRDIKPGQELSAAVVSAATPGASSGVMGKAHSYFASMMRPNLHSPVTTAPTFKKWAGPQNTPISPSVNTASYAFKHAAAHAKQPGTVFERLTDVRGFTGTHRHRFGTDGRGMGLKGRDRVEMDYEVTTKLSAANPIPSLGTYVRPKP